MEFDKIAEERKKEDRLSMRYCNLISSDRNAYVPFSSDQLDNKRKKFNTEIGADANNKLLYLTALCRYFNNIYLTTFRNPKEIGMTVTNSQAEIKNFLNNFNFDEEDS